MDVFCGTKSVSSGSVLGDLTFSKTKIPRLHWKLASLKDLQIWVPSNPLKTVLIQTRWSQNFKDPFRRRMWFWTAHPEVLHLLEPPSTSLTCLETDPTRSKTNHLRFHENPGSQLGIPSLESVLLEQSIPRTPETSWTSFRLEEVCGTKSVSSGSNIGCLTISKTQIPRLHWKLASLKDL